MKIGLDALITIVLMVLKLTGVIHVSWWIVFLPVIISTAFLCLALLGIGAIAVAKIKNGGRIQ